MDNRLHGDEKATVCSKIYMMFCSFPIWLPLFSALVMVLMTRDVYTNLCKI